jgi:hypothetical protein
MKKNGQLGKFVTTFFVMFMIFIVIGIYLVLSGLAFNLKGPDVPDVLDGFAEGDDVLLKEINVINMDLALGEDSEEEGDWMTLIHGLMRANIVRGNEMAYVKQGLIRALEKENVEGKRCFILCQDCVELKSIDSREINRLGDDIVLELIDGRFVGSEHNLASTNILAGRYGEKGLDKKFSISYERLGERHEIDLAYYYGGCLE